MELLHSKKAYQERARIFKATANYSGKENEEISTSGPDKIGNKDANAGSSDRISDGNAQEGAIMRGRNRLRMG